MITNNVPDNCPWPEETPTPVCHCAGCQGEIYAGELCWQIGDKLYCDGCVMEVIAGEG